MKGYIDRVFSYGFAYRYDQGVQKGLLKGKSTVIINTHGKSHEEYNRVGMDKALELTSDHGIFIYSGLNVIRHFFLTGLIRHLVKKLSSGKIRSEISILKSQPFLNLSYKHHKDFNSLS